MAVYERSYRRYDGPLTTRRQRFLVVPRYALADVMRGRAFVMFYLLCFFPPFAGLIVIYLRHNLSALKVLGLPLERLRQALPIDAGFFSQGLSLQAVFAFLMVVAVAPALVAPDLRNNGLALYLSRPFSRAEYMLGKLAVLALLISTITWVPGILLFLLQGYLEGGGWFGAQARVLGALFAGSWVLIIAYSLLALAVSAWVKWKPVARIALVILFFVTNAFGHIMEMALGTWWSEMISFRQVIETVSAGLFGLPPQTGMPVWAAWVSLVAGSLLCLALLARRVRAYEVVR
jgi:ABC-2 type transport system permease protein